MPELIEQFKHPLVEALDSELAQDQLEYLRSYFTAIADAMAPNTLRGFTADIRQFFQYCRDEGNTPIPASLSTIQKFIRYRADQGVSAATIARAISNLSKIHDVVGVRNEFRSEIIRADLKAQRRLNRKSSSQAPGIRYANLHEWDNRLAQGQDQSLALLRDRALLWLGYDGMLRSEEIARADISWIREMEDDALLEIPYHKTSQEKEELVYLSGHTLKILKAWFAAAGITHGAIIRSFSLSGKLQDAIHPNSISKIITKRAVEMGILGASSHSLRIGATQDLIERNESNARIQLAGRWKSDRMVVHYGRVHDLKTGAMATMAMDQGRTKRQQSPHSRGNE